MNTRQMKAIESHEKAHEFYSESLYAFYEWEKELYGNNSPLSDEDRLAWMRGYMYARTGETK